MWWLVIVVRRTLAGSTNDAVTLPSRIPSKQSLPRERAGSRSRLGTPGFRRYRATRMKPHDYSLNFDPLQNPCSASQKTTNRAEILPL